jgi:hypothetical protein
VRKRQPDQLEPWLARAAESPLMPLQRFAKGLRDDDDAVKAGVTLPWSNGPVEGHINRLNMLKRQMFGRASLDLLQRRFLLAASGWCSRRYAASGLHARHGFRVSAGWLSTRLLMEAGGTA